VGGQYGRDADDDDHSTLLVELLGEEATAVVVERAPHVLAAKTETLRAATKELVGFLGRAKAAVAVRRCPDVLMSTVIRRAMAALEEELGRERALALAEQNAVVLTAETIRESMAALEEELGRERAVAAVERNARVLTASAATIRAAMRELVGVLGPAKASRAAGGEQPLRADGDGDPGKPLRRQRGCWGGRRRCWLWRVTLRC
jgi:hypothetical protein